MRSMPQRENARQVADLEQRAGHTSPSGSGGLGGSQKGRATNAKRPRYVVVLTPARGVDDGVKRLRHLLKVASRSFGLVVISCREEEAEPAPPLTEEGSSS